MLHQRRSRRIVKISSGSTTKEDMISLGTISASGQRNNDKYKLIEEADDNDNDSEDEIIYHGNGKATSLHDHEVIETDDDDTATLIHHGGPSNLFDQQNESFLSISVQILFPFLIAGLGMVGAGIVLDIVQHWPVFETVNEIFILVPALLGLKGNLEMTLASRLSTQVNHHQHLS